MILERDLIRAINSGEAIALVGAGASIDVDLPTWNQLAWGATSVLPPERFGEIKTKIADLIDAGRQPEVFSIIAKEAGLAPLLVWLEKELKSFKRNGNLYPILAAWPFANYLTTNYDHALIHFLREEKVPAIERSSSLEDMRSLHSGTRNTVFHIHGDPGHPDDIILTSEQYDQFLNARERGYWREKIKSVMHMNRLVIIGYSLSDPYFLDYLERVKEYSSPERPIYVFASGFPEEQIVDILSRHNIVIVPYQNEDGSHRDLMRTLRRYGVFVAGRKSGNIWLEEIDEEELEIASSLYIFAKLRLGEFDTDVIANAYAVTILKTLTSGKKATRSELISLVERQLNITNPDLESLDGALNLLQQRGLVDVGTKLDFSITPSGLQEVSASVQERKAIEEQFNIACALFLHEQYPGIKEAEKDQLIAEMATGLTRAFERRGLEIARHVFVEQPIDPTNALDLLEIINAGSSKFENRDLAGAYLDLLIEIITRPNQEMMNYLALLVQGYFAFHTLGWDRRSADERLNIARESTWILDASVIIPALAKNSLNHKYAVDLLNRAKSIGLSFNTTRLLYEEVVEHASWAIDKFGRADPESHQLILAATGEAGYRSNLFLSGFISWSVENGSRDLHEYFEECFGENYSSDLRQSVKVGLTNFGIEIIEFSEADGFNPEFLIERDEQVLPQIIENRKSRGSYRSDEQCKAEAEVLILAKRSSLKFLTQSDVLDKITGDRISLSPEALYRYLALFSSVPPQPNLIYSSMASLFHSAGIEIVDIESIRKFVRPSFQQARLKLEKERTENQKLLGAALHEQHLRAIDNASEELKPFYSLRLLMLINEKESQKRKDAETRAAVVAQPLLVSEKLELERLRQKKKEKEQKRKRKRKPSKEKRKKKK